MTTFDVIDSPAISPVIDQAAAYAVLVKDAIDARQAIDIGRWLIGAYVRMLMDISVYGQHTLEDFADDIGIDPKRAYEYASMASYYSLGRREQISHLNLTYSHLREAKRLKDVDKSLAFLHIVFANVWTIQQTRDALKAMCINGGVYVGPTFDTSPITDMNNNRIDQRPVYQWRGPAIVTIDAKGIVRLQCDHAPEVEQGKRYMVSFEEY